MAKTLLTAMGVVVLGIGILATVDLPDQQPRLPVQLGGEQGLVVQGPNPDFPAGDHSLRVGDRILRVDGREVPNQEYLHFYLDGLRVGDRIELEVERAGRDGVYPGARLVPLLTDFAMVINFIVALGVWFFGMLIIVRGTLGRDVLLFYGQAMTLATVMFVYWPENTLSLPGGEYVCWFLSNGLYPMTVALLLHFALFFPEKQRSWLRKVVPFLYLPPVMVAAWLIVGVARARASLAPADVAFYLDAFSALRIYLATYFVAGPLLWAWTYVRTNQFETRQRLKWLFWGFTLGISPHVLLHELPEGLGFTPFVPEIISHICALFAASSMLFAIARYRILDVDLVIKRSLVYGLLTLFVVFAYLALVGLGDWLTIRLTGGESVVWVRLVVVLVVASVFAPTRNLAHRLVDRVFFRSQHDQRVALVAYSRDLARTIDIRDLSERICGLFDRIPGADRVRVYVTGGTGGGMHQVLGTPHATGGQDHDLDDSQLDRLGLHRRERAFARPAESVDLRDLALLVPLRVDGQLVGLIGLGPKKSGQVYHPEDLEFVNAVSDQTAVAFATARAFREIQDLNVHLEQMVYDRTAQLAEANNRLVEQYDRLKKLDELKESLTRMVVHDLKNPVGTILIGTEYLERSDADELKPDIRQTMEMIRNTAREMQELIANLLDVNRMEEGELALDRVSVPVSEVISQGLDRVRLLARYHQVEFEVDGHTAKVPCVDRALFTRMLINLLTNAVKFAPRGSQVTISAGDYERDGESGLWLAIANLGPAVPSDLQERIFEKFFQAAERRAVAYAGAGLGLPFCKMVAEAHGGRIVIESPLEGKTDGSRFVVYIPDAC